MTSTTSIPVRKLAVQKGTTPPPPPLTNATHRPRNTHDIRHLATAITTDHYYWSTPSQATPDRPRYQAQPYRTLSSFNSIYLFYLAVPTLDADHLLCAGCFYFSGTEIDGVVISQAMVSSGCLHLAGFCVVLLTSRST